MTKRSFAKWAVLIRPNYSAPPSSRANILISSISCKNVFFGEQNRRTGLNVDAGKKIHDCYPVQNIVRNPILTCNDHFIKCVSVI